MRMKEGVVLRIVVNNLVIWFVETSSKVLLRKSQPNSIGNTLAKRTYTRVREEIIICLTNVKNVNSIP